MNDTTPSDPLLFDAEALRELASERIVSRGVAYFQEHRVTSVRWEPGRLWAEVEGSDLYLVDVAIGEDRQIVVDCTCPFDGESACKHAVAALLAYADRQGPVDPQLQIRDAADEAVADRRKRARTQVVAQHIAGDPTFGCWEARSLTPAGEKLRPYRVELRSVTERINHCTCPDFATNRLGTCKHIEAVLHRLGQRHKRRTKTAARRGPDASVVYLDWDVTDPPRVRVRRRAKPSAEERSLLDAHFDALGELRGLCLNPSFSWRATLRPVASGTASTSARTLSARPLA